MNLPLYIAKRFLKGEKGSKDQPKRASKPAIRVATFGVAIGIAVMIISISVVGGYKKEIGKKITGFTSHIEILSPRTLYAPDAAPLTVDSNLTKGIGNIANVKRIARVSEKIGILKTIDAYQGIRLKGISSEYDTTFLYKNLVAGRLPKIQEESPTNEILLSQSQVDALQIELGSSVYAYFFEEAIKTRRFKVVGIFKTNLKIFDNSYVLTDIHSANKLNGWDENKCSYFEIYTADFNKANETCKAISPIAKKQILENGETPITITAKELYPQIFSWLELLDFNIWVILLLMVCVGIFTMISGLLILILERTSAIGTLKALGATNTQIRHTFLYFAAFIIRRGLFWGNLLGLGFILIQDKWGIIRLNADNYYMEIVPVELNLLHLLFLNIGTLLITIFALIAPSLIISKIEPAKVIRFD